MKTKVHTLRAQKKGLDSKIVEMQSTISSLREEQRTIELALEENQNAIKQMRERYTEASNDNPQVIALSEMLRQKESEVEDLKSRLKPPVKVWSVSMDDPSSANINLQTDASVTGRGDTKAIEEKETTTGLEESTNHEAGENSTELADGGSEPAEIRNGQHKTEGEDTRKAGGETIDGRGKITEQTDKVDDPKEIISEHGSTNLEERNAEEEGKDSYESQTEEASGAQEKKNPAQIQAVEYHDNEGQRLRDETIKGYSTEDKVIKTTEDGLQGRISNSQGAENKEPEMKLEVSNHPQIGRNRLEGKGDLRRTKRKKSNKILKTRKNTGSSERNGAAATNNKSFIESTIKSQMDQDGYQETMHINENHYKTLSEENNSGSEDHENSIVEKPAKDEFSEKEMSEQGDHGEEQKDLGWKKVETGPRESKDISQGIEMFRHDEVAEELSKDRNTTYGVKVEKNQRVNDTSKTTEMEDEMLSKTKQQNKLEPETSGNQATSTQQSEEIIDAHIKDEISEQTDNVNSDEEPDNSQMEDATKTEAETDASRESVLHSKADGSSYKKDLRSQSFS